MGNANLENADLRGADLANANMANANMGNADVRGANFQGTIFEEVIRHQRAEEQRRQREQEGQRRRDESRRRAEEQRRQQEHRIPDLSSELQQAVKILGITPNATEKQISKAYLKQAKLIHPDRNPDRKEWATERMKELNHARDEALKHAKKWPDSHDAVYQ